MKLKTLNVGPTVNIRVSLTELVSAPLSQAQLEAYRRHCAHLNKLANRFVVTRMFLVSANFVLAALLANSHGVLTEKMAVVLAAFEVLAFGALIAGAGGYALARAPMSLCVEGVERTQGTLAAPFEPVTLQTNNLSGSPEAVRFYNNILLRGRQPVAFEKVILQSMCAL